MCYASAARTLQKITGSDVRDFTFTSPAEPSVTANWDGQTIDMPIFNDIMEPVEEEKLWLSTTIAITQENQP